MNESMVLEIVKEVIYNTIIVSAPMLLVAMLVGLIISIFQATTQIQEQTLTFVPKFIAICITIIISFTFIMNTAVNFMEKIFNLISTIVG